MKGRVLVKVDDSLKKMAEDIFGKDYVKQAWTCGHYFYNDEDRKEAVEKLKKYERKYLNQGVFRYDTEDIIIEFTNGKKVKFSNSQWAYISRLTQEMIDVDQIS